MPNFVIISGFVMTGKTVLTDIFKEFSNYHVPPHTFEFNLIRIQGGLLDLQNALIDDFSPIRSDFAIKVFKQNVERMGTVASFKQPKSLFIANGMNYNHFFNNKFIEISNNYIESFIDFDTKTVWPFQSTTYSYLKVFYQRLLRFFFPDKIFLEKIYSVDNNFFLKKTRSYLSKLFSEIGNNDTKTYILHNSIEPYNIKKSLNLFNDAKLIVVFRDPRDIYVSSKIKEKVYVPGFEVNNHWKLKSLITFSDDIDIFIKRQKILYSNVKFKSTEDVLFLRFEDLVNDYNKTLKILYKFLKISSKIHNQKFKFFKPELSSKNIGIWKKYSNQKEIEKIYKCFPELCYD
tara:strand:- start:4171 stop:5208 length:1038 start_codon:yes stop_codon:yes gene_type:complete